MKIDPRARTTCDCGWEGRLDELASGELCPRCTTDDIYIQPKNLLDVEGEELEDFSEYVDLSEFSMIYFGEPCQGNGEYSYPDPPFPWKEHRTVLDYETISELEESEKTPAEIQKYLKLNYLTTGNMINKLMEKK